MNRCLASCRMPGVILLREIEVRSVVSSRELRDKLANEVKLGKMKSLKKTKLRFHETEWLRPSFSIASSWGHLHRHFHLSYSLCVSGPLYPNTLCVLWSRLRTLVSLVTSGRLSFSMIRFSESKRLPLQPQWIGLLAGYSIQSLDSWVVSWLPRVRGSDLLPKVLLGEAVP